MSLGYSFKDLVLICIFDGKNCDETEFWTYYHSTYGNCYTFNTGKYGPVKRSTMPGPSHGKRSCTSCIFLVLATQHFAGVCIFM